jgi:hypothetical protein
MMQIATLCANHLPIHAMIVTFTHALHHPSLLLCDTIHNVSWYRSTAYVYRKIISPTAADVNVDVA